jgi:hypothetical protein
VVAVAGIAGCSRPSPPEEAQQRVRHDVVVVRDGLSTDLQHLSGMPPAEDLVRAVVRNAALRGTATVADAVWRGPSLSTTLVFTSDVQRGGGLGYESWAARGCVQMTGTPGGDPQVQVRDVPCPVGVTPDPGPANTTIPVAP